MGRLRIAGLHKRFGQVDVLQGIDVDLDDGSYLVLIGPSGCGKSTLLRCIAGLEEPTSGTLHIGDRDITHLPPAERDVAMVFQSYALYPHMTVRANLGFALEIRRRPKAEIEAAVQDAAGLLGLTPLLDRMPAQLSGGQRQRVAMGRAIVRRPSAFLFDEPLSNLDPALRATVRLELKRLHARLRTTVVHVTHDPVEALTLADRILVLDRGVVQQFGTPSELYAAPANPFVATFVAPMNLLPADPDGAGLRVRDSAWRLPGEAARPVQIGVRPSDIALRAGSTGQVDVIERMGAEAVVHVRVGPHDVSAAVREPCPWGPGDVVDLNAACVHLFDSGSGRRLGGWAGPPTSEG
jgi:multiple sugar transport system ATP-binding protein